MGGGEDVHQEEGSWLGLRGNLQALTRDGQAQQPVNHKLGYSHRVGTWHLHVPFELWLKSQLVFILSVHNKNHGA